MIANSQNRRHDWLMRVEHNHEFTNGKCRDFSVILVEYRKTGYMNNTEHLAHYQFRNEHTELGELGVQVRTYQTSKDRAQTAESYYGSLLPDRTPLCNKRSVTRGDVTRKNLKTEHKNHNVRHKQFDDTARINDGVRQHGRNCLPESFNTQLYMSPVWRDTKKSKWMSLKGFDTYAGAPAAHVRLHSSGTGICESHRNSVNEKSAWQQLHNANVPGDEPFTKSFRETAKSFNERQRHPEGEMGAAQFDSTCKRGLPFDAKIKVESL